MTAEEFGRLFRTFRESTFRLETLSQYIVPQEAEELRRFVEGRPRPEPREGSLEWQAMIRANVAAGKRMQRVHLIRGPLTDYLRYQLAWGYPPNAAAGEDIHVVHVGQDGAPELGGEDFWLFDDALAVPMRYDDEGHWLGADAIREPARVEDYLARRNVSLAAAVPLRDYVLEVGAR